MRDHDDRPTKRDPLHVTLSVAFAALLLLFGFTLIAFHYHESRRVALISADETLQRVSDRMRASVGTLYAPAQNVVDVFSKTRDP